MSFGYLPNESLNVQERLWFSTDQPGKIQPYEQAMSKLVELLKAEGGKGKRLYVADGTTSAAEENKRQDRIQRIAASCTSLRVVKVQGGSWQAARLSTKEVSNPEAAYVEIGDHYTIDKVFYAGPLDEDAPLACINASLGLRRKPKPAPEPEPEPAGPELGQRILRKVGVRLTELCLLIAILTVLVLMVAGKIVVSVVKTGWFLMEKFQRPAPPPYPPAPSQNGATSSVPPK